MPTYVRGKNITEVRKKKIWDTKNYKINVSRVEGSVKDNRGRHLYKVTGVARRKQRK